MKSPLRDWVEVIAVVAAIIALFVGMVYVTRVLPYDNDWSCALAECRRVK